MQENISQTYTKNGDYKNAYAAITKALDLKDSMLNDNKKQEITRLAMQYQFDKKEASIKAKNDKQQALASAEIDRQKLVNKVMMAGACFLIVGGFSGFAFYKRNRDITLLEKRS